MAMPHLLTYWETGETLHITSENAFGLLSYCPISHTDETGTVLISDAGNITLHYTDKEMTNDNLSRSR